jgi:hypothetical protein
VLRKICVSKEGEVADRCRKIHKEELYDLYYPPNIIRVIKSRIMRWAGHVARMGGRGLVGRPDEKNHFIP